MMGTFRKMRVAVALLMLCGAQFVQAAEAEPTLRVVPQFPALEIHRTWTPLAKAIESAAGRPVRLKNYASIPVFERDYLAGVPDLVYLNPYQMVLANRARRYVPLVRDNTQQLSGILLVQTASKITRLPELQGGRSHSRRQMRLAPYCCCARC
jgi:phosphonate transport system substrate-binding protein